MNKHIIPLFALLVGVAAFSSCEDQLDIPQKGVTSESDFYKTDADCAKALASAYEGFMVNTLGRTTISGGPGIYTPARVLANDPGDDVLYGGGNYGDHEFGGAVNQFRYLSNPEAINYHYKGLYLSVHSDNLVIEKFKERAPGLQLLPAVVLLGPAASCRPSARSERFAFQQRDDTATIFRVGRQRVPGG